MVSVNLTHFYSQRNTSDEIGNRTIRPSTFEYKPCALKYELNILQHGPTLVKHYKHY